MFQQGVQSHAFYERAKRVMPYGVSSNYRYYGEYETPVIARAQGGYIYDFDGNEYVDLRLGWGPVLLGHGSPLVNERVKQAIDHGATLAATQPYEVSVAERIVALCPGVDKVRLMNTGTECTMHALRLARGYTGRDLILKFEGSYHGAHDAVLWTTQAAPIDQLTNPAEPFVYKQSTGIPEAVRALVQLCPWNDPEALGAILKERGETIAAIIIEPMLGNANALVPAPGFLPFLRTECDRYGIVLIFDEVKTGFRIAPGGAREYFGVIPDLSTYAKALGNGYPIAALAGKEEIMMTFAPGKVFHAGTYSGNMVSTAAADAVLEQIQSGRVFAHLEQIGRLFMAGLAEICTRHSLPYQISGAPAMFGFCFAEERPRDWRELMTKGNWALSRKVWAHLIANGVWPEPGGVEPFFICASHSAADIEKALTLFEDGVQLALQR